MKRYEIMSKEDIIEAFEANDHILEIKKVIECLDEEIELVSRWQNIKSNEDLDGAVLDFFRLCNQNVCDDRCPYYNPNSYGQLTCFEKRMLEQVERK